MIAKTRAELPEKYRCRKCRRKKPIAEMILIYRKKQKHYLLRPRCKECHNKKERRHRRQWKTRYLRAWRARNAELNRSYWDNPERRKKATQRARRKRRNQNYCDALAIQRRLRSRSIKVTFREAKQLLQQYGPCYPTRFGLTPEGLKECERIRSRKRLHGDPVSTIEIRMMVYEDGSFITPERQKRPFQKAAERLRNWWKRQRTEVSA